MEALARRAAGENPVALLDLTREYRAYRHELLAACERVLERMQLLGGEEVRAFESEMAAYLGVRQVCGWPRHRRARAGAPGSRPRARRRGPRAGERLRGGGGAIQRAAARRSRPTSAWTTSGPTPTTCRASDAALARRPGRPHARLPVDLRPILALARARGLVVIETARTRTAPRSTGGASAPSSRGRLQPGRGQEPRRYGDAGLVSTDDTASRSG